MCGRLLGSAPVQLIRRVQHTQHVPLPCRHETLGTTQSRPRQHPQHLKDSADVLPTDARRGHVEERLDHQVRGTDGDGDGMGDGEVLKVWRRCSRDNAWGRWREQLPIGRHIISRFVVYSTSPGLDVTRLFPPTNVAIAAAFRGWRSIG